MDSQSRQTASTYINNLLLARGLLRNGKTIEFAAPGEVDGGLDATMSQVMNLVHDLILRRDRDSDTLSNLSQSVSKLRNQSSDQVQTIRQLEGERASIDRQLALVSAQERGARASLRTAESRNRSLREETARLKGSAAQVRAQCATDVRRRDTEIARMKKHLEGRRARDGPISGHVTVAVVTPVMTKTPTGTRVCPEGAETACNPGEALKQETTEFLTRLSQDLGDENDALIGLLRGTLATLRSVQGLQNEDDHQQGGEINEALGRANGVMDGAPVYETLATSMDEVLEHLRSLLTNPSFVPLEEVFSRDEEIRRLRDGWEMMAVRWKEAVALMDGWKKRMVDEGDTINLEDLKDGLKLGSGIPTAQEARNSPLKTKDAAAVDSDFWDFKGAAQRPDAGSFEHPFGADASRLHGDDIDIFLKETNANLVSGKHPRKACLPSLGSDLGSADGDDPQVSLAVPQDENRAVEGPSKERISRIPFQKFQTSASSPTVEQKLARAKSEAEEAQKMESYESKTRNASKSIKRGKKGSRRRSTLSPEELEILVDG